MTNPFSRRADEQLERLKAQSLSQQDEIRHLKKQLEQAETDRAEAVKERALAWEQVANWLAKRSGLGTISIALEQVPDAPQPEMEPVEQQKPLARDVQSEAWAQFDKDLKAYAQEQLAREDLDGSGN